MVKCWHAGLILNVDKYELLAISACIQIPERLRARYPVGINADIEHGCNCIHGYELFGGGIFGCLGR